MSSSRENLRFPLTPPPVIMVMMVGHKVIIRMSIRKNDLVEN